MLVYFDGLVDYSPGRIVDFNNCYLNTNKSIKVTSDKETSKPFHSTMMSIFLKFLNKSMIYFDPLPSM